jgi:acyl carrier protein
VGKRSENEAEQLRERLFQVIADQFGVRGENIKNESHFIYDLGLDSLDLAQLQLEMEEEFKIEVSDMDMKEVATVGDALLFLKKALGQR